MSRLEERSGYSAFLRTRTSNPIEDAHDPSVTSHPDHWVPTMVANLTRAASEKFTTFQQDPERKPSGSWKQRHFRLAREQESDHHLLPHLAFENPWESFKSPGLKDILGGGLRWGLPQGYSEGEGKSWYKGKSLKKVQADDQDRVEVKKPQWKDWVGDMQARVTWLGHATVLLQLPPLKPERQGNQDIDMDDTPNGDATAKDTAPDATLQDDTNKHAPSNGDAAASDGHAPVKEADNSDSQSHKPSVQAPREDVSNRYINILFDPVFSERCSPSQSAGPQRFTPAPCSISDLPPIDAVIISHSHFDHLDYLSMKEIQSLRRRKVHCFVPLGLKDRIVSFGWDVSQVSELDWWDSAVLQLAAFSKSRLITQEPKLRITCTPAQHGSGRGAGDKDTTLWASWVVEHLPQGEEVGYRAFFAGDTGLKYHHDNVEKRHKYPTCPAFKDIKDKVGAPDLLLLPISVGSSLSYFRSWDPFPRAYSPFPRVGAALTSSIHMDPHDAAEAHTIMKGDKSVSLAVHYGTFVRNNHQTEADVRALRSACERLSIPFQRADAGDLKLSKDVFLVSHQGETIALPFRS